MRSTNTYRANSIQQRYGHWGCKHYSGIVWESALRDRQANVLLQDHKVYKELINHIIL